MSEEDIYDAEVTVSIKENVLENVLSTLMPEEWIEGTQEMEESEGWDIVPWEDTTELDAGGSVDPSEQEGRK